MSGNIFYLELTESCTILQEEARSLLVSDSLYMALNKTNVSMCKNKLFPSTYRCCEYTMRELPNSIKYLNEIVE